MTLPARSMEVTLVPTSTDPPGVPAVALPGPG